MNQETILHRIRTLLARFQEEVRIDNVNGEFSINMHAENVLIHILNVAYDLELVNINYEEGKNFPAIDLTDDEKKTAFQITSSGTVKKVVHSLKEFAKNGLDQKYNYLYFYFLKGMDTNVKENNLKISQEAGRLDQVVLYFLDNEQFYLYLNKLNDLNKLKKILEFMEEQFSDADLPWNQYSDISEKAPPALTSIPTPTRLYGRDKAVSDIQEIIRTKDIVCIYADGGVGKTAVAENVMSHVRKDKQNSFNHYAWINSSDDLQKDMTQLDIPAAKARKSDKEKKEVVKTFLQLHPTFIVIDNINEPLNQDDRDFLNTVSEKAKIMITSRMNLEDIEGYKLANLDSDAALDFFYECYLGKDAYNGEALTKRKDAKYVREIIASVSYNAFIIQLIGKNAFWEFPNRLSKLWDELKALLEDNKKNNLDLESIGKLYKLSVLTKERQEIMNFMAMFPDEMCIFDDCLKWAGFNINDLKWLFERAWIDKKENGFFLHTLVTMSVHQQRMKFDIWKYEDLIRELSYTNNYLKTTDGYTTFRKRLNVVNVLCNILIKRIEEKLLFIDENYELLCNTGDFFNNIAAVYDQQGNYKEALEKYLITKEIREKVLGPEELSTAKTYNNLAGVYLVQGKLQEALDYNLKALKIREKKIGTYHPDTAVSYNNLAGVYEAQGQYQKAKKFYKKALKTYEQILKTDDLDTAMIYNNLASVYSAQRNHEEALKNYKKALDIRKKIFGLCHPEIATVYNSIAGVYQAQKDYEEALNNYKRAQRIREIKLGTDHPDTSATYNNIARVYQAQGNFDKALDYNLKALDIREKILGHYHPDTATTYNNIAGVYEGIGKYEEALDKYKTALNIRETVFGKNHPSTAEIYNNTGLLYKNQRKYSDALQSFMEAKDIREKVLGKDHPSTLATYKSLSEVYQALGKSKIAREYHSRAHSKSKLLKNITSLFN